MRHNFNLLIRGIALCSVILFYAGCSQDDSLKPQDNQSLETRGLTGPGGGAGVKYFYGLSDQNTLYLFKPGPPVTTVSSVPIVGLGSTEHILAIDFRLNGQLYGVSDLNLIYVIDVTSGQAKVVSRAPFEPGLKGAYIGMDFDPAADKIRIVTDEDQNIVLDPDQGNVFSVDSDINPPSTNVNAIAYGWSTGFGVPRSFPLYDIDISRGWLCKQVPPYKGTIVPVASLGMVIGGEGGFDISRSNPNTGLAALYGHSTQPGGGGGLGDNLGVDAYRVWEITLSNGKAAYRGKLPRNIIGLSIP